MWAIPVHLQQFCMILPCQSNTLDFCRNALKAYGESGDCTLEYIGINLIENEISEQRVYRKKTPILMDLIDKEGPYAYILEDLMKSFAQKKSISLCDVSQSLAHGCQTFRAVFSLPKKQNREDATRDINDFFACISGDASYRERFEEKFLKYDNCSETVSPLLQIGVEVDCHHQLRGIKYYFRIRDFSSLEGFDMSWKDITGWQCRKLCEGDYKPIFIGINDYGGAIEEKVYFISKAVGFKKTDVLENQKKLAKAFGWMISEDILDGLYEMNLYPEGIALSAQEHTWRLYFREFLKRGNGL